MAVRRFEVRNLGGAGSAGSSARCLDLAINRHEKEKPVGLYPCHGGGGNQYWMFSKDGEIRRDESCIDYAGKKVMIFPCHGMKGNQEWLYNHSTGRLYHPVSKLCLEMAKTGAELLMKQCDEDEAYQKWKFGDYNAEKAKQYNVAAP